MATFDEDDCYDQADSAGFINLFGLPIKVRALNDQALAAKTGKHFSGSGVIVTVYAVSNCSQVIRVPNIFNDKSNRDNG